MIRKITLLATTLALGTTCNTSPSLEEGLALANETQEQVPSSEPANSSDLKDLTYGGLLSAIRRPQDESVQKDATKILVQRINKEAYSELLLSPDDTVYRLGDVVPDIDDLAQMGDWVMVAKPSSRIFSQNINPYLMPSTQEVLMRDVSWLVTTPLLLSSAINDERSQNYSGTVYFEKPWTIFLGGSGSTISIDHGRFLLTLTHEIDHVEKFDQRTKRNCLSRLEIELSAYRLSLDQLDHSLELGLVDEIFAEDYRSKNNDRILRGEYLLDLDPAFGVVYPKERILPSQILEADISDKVLKEHYLALYGETLTSNYQEELFWALLYASIPNEHEEDDAVSLLCVTYDDPELVGLRRNAVLDTLTYLVPGYSAEDICAGQGLLGPRVEGGELKVSHPYRDIPNGDKVLIFPGLQEP